MPNRSANHRLCVPVMVVIVLIPVLILFAALALAAKLLCPETVSEQGLADLNRSLAEGHEYEPTRSLVEEHWSADRGTVIRRYLKRLRGDFLTAWTVCRLLGPISRDADGASRLYRRWLGFHGLLAVAWVKTYIGQSSHSVGQPSRLTETFGELRQRATALMQLDAGMGADGSPVRRIRI